MENNVGWKEKGRAGAHRCRGLPHEKPHTLLGAWQAKGVNCGGPTRESIESGCCGTPCVLKPTNTASATQAAPRILRHRRTRGPPHSLRITVAQQSSSVSGGCTGVLRRSKFWCCRAALLGKSGVHQFERSLIFEMSPRVRLSLRSPQKTKNVGLGVFRGPPSTLKSKMPEAGMVCGAEFKWSPGRSRAIPGHSRPARRDAYYPS